MDMDKVKIAAIAGTIDSVGAAIVFIADGIREENPFLHDALVLLADLLSEMADDLRRIEREEAGTR